MRLLGRSRLSWTVLACLALAGTGAALWRLRTTNYRPGTGEANTPTRPANWLQSNVSAVSDSAESAIHLETTLERLLEASLEEYAEQLAGLTDRVDSGSHDDEVSQLTQLLVECKGSARLRALAALILISGCGSTKRLLIINALWADRSSAALGYVWALHVNVGWGQLNPRTKRDFWLGALADSSLSPLLLGDRAKDDLQERWDKATSDELPFGQAFYQHAVGSSLDWGLDALMLDYARKGANEAARAECLRLASSSRELGDAAVDVYAADGIGQPLRKMALETVLRCQHPRAWSFFADALERDADDVIRMSASTGLVAATTPEKRDATLAVLSGLLATGSLSENERAHHYCNLSLVDTPDAVNMLSAYVTAAAPSARPDAISALAHVPSGSPTVERRVAALAPFLREYDRRTAAAAASAIGQLMSSSQCEAYAHDLLSRITENLGRRAHEPDDQFSFVLRLVSAQLRAKLRSP